MSHVLKSLFMAVVLTGYVLPFVSAVQAQTNGRSDREIDIIEPPHMPRMQPDYQVEALELLIDIDGQKASVIFKQTISNKGNIPLEMDYLAPLPLDGAVSGLTLMVDGKELVGKVYERDEALAIYRRIVSEIRDPALLEYAGRGLYRSHIFPIPVKESRTLELRMDYLLTKDNGQISLAFPLAGPLTQGKTVKKQDVVINIKNNPGLNNVYSPLDGVDVKYDDGRAVATFKMDDAPALDVFHLYFKADSGPIGGLVLSHRPSDKEDGFFLFMAEPKITVKSVSQPKNVVFVLDKSGSMNGVKFNQAQAALKYVLERLAPEDSFNLVDYSSRVSTWQPELMPMNKENRRNALNYVDNLRSGGATNISEALKSAFKQAGTSSAYILFLTDGLPTEGLTDEMELTKLADAQNKNNFSRLFSFGVGFDVNARLLDRLSGQAGGVTVFVSPDEDIEAKVSSFFSKLTSPVLTDPKIKVGLKTNRVIPERLPDIFQGGQMVVVGRYPKAGKTTFSLIGQVSDQKSNYEFETDLASGPVEGGDFIARLWAQRRIGEIIDEIDLNPDRENKELVNELVELSKHYGIMTPYTSFLALEKQSLTDMESNARLAEVNLGAIGEVVGSSANMQRELKQSFKSTEKLKAPAQAESSRRQMESMAFIDAEVAQNQDDRLIAPRQLGSKTFYSKNGQLVDSSMTDKDLKSVKSVVQFSDEYFALLETLGPEEKVWLSQSEPVLFNSNKVNYLIEPAI